MNLYILYWPLGNGSLFSMAPVNCFNNPAMKIMFAFKLIAGKIGNHVVYQIFRMILAKIPSAV